MSALEQWTTIFGWVVIIGASAFLMILLWFVIGFFAHLLDDWEKSQKDYQEAKQYRALIDAILLGIRQHPDIDRVGGCTKVCDLKEKPSLWGFSAYRNYTEGCYFYLVPTPQHSNDHVVFVVDGKVIVYKT